MRKHILNLKHNLLVQNLIHRNPGNLRTGYPDDMGDASLEYFCLQKLPPSVRTVIAGLTGSLDALAERADRVMEATRGSELAEVNAPPRRRCAAVFPPTGGLDSAEPREVAVVNAHYHQYLLQIW